MNNTAAAILNHYFAQLARAAGLRWSERNAADIERAVSLMSSADEALDEVPPYQPPTREVPIRSERVTQVLDRNDFGDANFGQWRRDRRQEDTDDARRIMRREDERR